MALSLRLSGGASNADPNTSLGGAMSSHAAAGSLLAGIAAAQQSGASLYRCLYVVTDADESGLSARVQNETPSARTTITLGWGTAGVDGTEQTIADQATAPAGVTFSASPPAVGPLGAGQRRPLWIRYDVEAGDVIAPEQFTISLLLAGDGWTENLVWTENLAWSGN